MDMTPNQALDKVEKWAGESASITTKQFREGMNMRTGAGKRIEMAARYMFKYGTLHGVYGTPQYKVNGVDVSGVDDIGDWIALLDPLLVEAAKGSTAAILSQNRRPEK